MGQNQICLFGGLESANDQDETWIYNFISNNWILDENGFNPSARRDPNFCETSLDGSSYIVLYGGESGTENFDDTWTFGGGDYPVPVELSSFSAYVKNREVELKWTTQSEVNNLGFIIERSFEEKSGYIEIASYQTNPELQGKGNTTHQSEYSFTDQNLQNGITYYYRLIDVDFIGTKTYHGPISANPNSVNIEIEKKEQVASRFHLYPNYPNPFNPVTNIKFEIPEKTNGPEEIELTIFDNLGQDVKSLFGGQLNGGIYEVLWDGTNNSGKNLPSGCYYVRLQSENYSITRKILLLR